MRKGVKLEGITKITYEVQYLVLNTKCDIMVCFHDTNKSDSYYFKFTLEGAPLFAPKISQKFISIYIYH